MRSIRKTKEVAESKTYYIYTLAKPDGTIFYVGKGCLRKEGNKFLERIDDHEREVAKFLSGAQKQGWNLEKIKTIQEVWAEGGQVVKHKIYETPVERDAYIYEWALSLWFMVLEISPTKPALVYIMAPMDRLTQYRP